MRVLVACEESQAVTIELRRLGHEAYSCDLQECSGGHPEWHIQNDVLAILPKRDQTNPVQLIEFQTMDGKWHEVWETWDMVIAFPPCTYLTLTGNRWFNVEKYGNKAVRRIVDRENAIRFFEAIADADCPRIAIENPIGVMNRRFRKLDQIIHPWQFAVSDAEKTEKSTCLWLKGLDPLVPFHTNKPEMAYHEWLTQDGRKKRQVLWYYQTRCLPHSERARAASKTFPGIAKAMAEQWAGPCEED